jgi:glycosyltransferase involved in cell wall biosynthesis
MLRLSLALGARGLDVDLACPEPPSEAGRSLAGEARAAGLAPRLAIPRGRGARWLRDAGAAAELRALVLARRIDLIHCWHTRDHLLALRVRGRARRPVIVRSYRSAERIARSPWNRWLFGPGADGVLCVSPGTARTNAGLRGGRPIAGLHGAVDLERFRPVPPDPAVRRELGLAPDHRVVGIVARVQRHRRFDLLLAAAARLFAAMPEARLLVIGRGTHRAELAERPAPSTSSPSWCRARTEAAARCSRPRRAGSRR